ncbi:MAG: InlB B-repeat-containing protein [Treponema sp.]|nr:InlB B-repeat-containing protein [Treponema sp.]
MIHFKKMTRLLCGILIIAGCISCSTSTSGGESTENTNENSGNNGGNTENTNENSGNSGGSKENTGNNGGNTQPGQSSQKYTVTYETRFGDVEKITVTENTVLTEKELPVFPGVRYYYHPYVYVFDGWYDGDTLALAGSYTVTRDVTLVAKWTKTYSVHYWTAHGTAPDEIWLKENTVLTSEHLPEITTEDGYIFDGWYTSTSYNDDYKVLVDSYTLTNYIYLYAKWIRNSSVSAELINDDTEISITAEQHGSLWTLTADEGFENYVWRIEGEVQTNAESASLEVDTATWAKGLYEVTVEAEKNGAFYSARVYITAGGN